MNNVTRKVRRFKRAVMAACWGFRHYDELLRMAGDAQITLCDDADFARKRGDSLYVKEYAERIALMEDLERWLMTA